MNGEKDTFKKIKRLEAKIEAQAIEILELKSNLMAARSIVYGMKQAFKNTGIAIPENLDSVMQVALNGKPDEPEADRSLLNKAVGAD